MAKIYRFRVTLRCHLANGDIDTLRNYRVAVEARTKADARDVIAMVASNMVHDEGSHLLDAPLDYLEVLHVEDD
jgi:hypothetical protein